MKKIQILHDDKDFLFLNKPAGLIVHSDGKTIEPSLCDWILKNYPKLKNVGEPLRTNYEERLPGRSVFTKAGSTNYEKEKINEGEKEKEENSVPIHNSKFIIHNSILRPGIVHRLDRETSGVIVVAKNQKAFEFLKEQFQNRKIQKTYLAFVYGELKKDEDKIDRPIGRSKNDFRKWSAQRGTRGELREAVTEYKVLERGNGYSYVEVMPKTGRTHQIRVHFKAINYPIVCDSLYASNMPEALGFKRLALHSRSLEFELKDGKKIKIEAPLPADFKKAEKLLKNA
ncbi:MAG: RluA family pseudouridine synthase, partial [Candidatus Paceibacterota bacterium]